MSDGGVDEDARAQRLPWQTPTPNPEASRRAARRALRPNRVLEATLSMRLPGAGQPLTSMNTLVSGMAARMDASVEAMALWDVQLLLAEAGEDVVSSEAGSSDCPHGHTAPPGRWESSRSMVATPAANGTLGIRCRLGLVEIASELLTNALPTAPRGTVSPGRGRDRLRWTARRAASAAMPDSYSCSSAARMQLESRFCQ